MRKRHKIARMVSLSTLITFLGLLFIFPLYIMIINSLKDRAGLYMSPIAFPDKFLFDNYGKAASRMNLSTSLLNSVLITGFSVFFIVLFSSMCAWMIARRNDRKSRIIYYSFVLTMLIPFQTLMMPLVQMMKWFKQALGIPVLNTYYGMVFMYIGFGMSLAVFLFHGFIKSIPIALEEAAMLDGASIKDTFFKIVFPMLKPTTMTVIILDIIWIWNDYLLPSLVLTSKAKRTIPLSTSSFFGVFTIQWNEAMAGLTMAIIPVIIFYFCAQKYIVKGISAGAVK